MYEKRPELSQNIVYSYLPGIAGIAAGSILYYIGIKEGMLLSQNDYVSLLTFAALVFWIGGFISFFGLKTFKTASFPLMLLFLMVPVPQFMMDGLIHYLRVWSTEVSYGFFKIAGIPVARDGFIMNLPGLSVEVAPECSGIRSTLALYITGILSCFLFIKTWRSRTVLLLLLFPLSIFKNGLRIVTLTLLAINVNESWLTNSRLHHEGGFVFFLATLLVFGGIIWLLRKWEMRHA